VLERIINACVRRRLAAIAVTLAIGAYGLHAYRNTAIEAYPDVTNLQVNIITQMPGLGPEEIERQVTVPLERALNGTPGMIGMRSESLFALSLIAITFEDGADGFRARMMVGERIAAAELPDGVIARRGPDNTPLGQIFQYRLVSDRHSLHELRSEQEWTLARVFRQVPGVAEVVGRGGFFKEVHVEVDPDRLLAHGLVLADVTEALEQSNRNIGGGYLRQAEQEFLIRSIGYISSPEDIQNVVLRSEGGTPVTVGDVAQVVLSHTPRRGTTGIDLDKDIVEGVVFLRRGENPSLVLAGIHEKVEELNRSILPEGMQLEIYYDRSELVGLTLKTVHSNLLHGALLIVALAWLFLRSVRGSIIVATVIPLSLLTAFIGLYLLGLPANLISMGAIDFGIIVDAAVILVENVIHQLRHHKPRTRREMLPMIVKAATSVARPTFYAMAIIIAALIPVFTLERVEGRIFRPLAMTYGFALTGALIFSLTVVPALCVLLLRPRDANVSEPATVERIRTWYRGAVAELLRWRSAVLAAGLALLIAGGAVGSRLGTEFLPELDEGDFVIFVEMPSSVSLETGQEILLEARRRLLGFPEVRMTVSQQGRPEDGTDNESVNMSETIVRLKPRAEWRRGWDKDRLTEAMRESLSEIPGVRFNFSQPIKDNIEEAMSGVRGQVVLKIFGHDLDRMRETLQRAIVVLQDVPGIVDLDLFRDRAVPELQIVLDRPALAREGISIDLAQDVIETALAGKVTTEWWEGERPVPVRVRLPLVERADPERVAELQVPSASGGHVRLRDISRVEVVAGRSSISHEANSRFLALKFNVEGRDLGSTIREGMRRVASDLEVPDGTYLEWGGEFENQQRAMKRLAVIVPISMLVVLALLYSALGTLRSAGAVLLLAPFGMTGGLFGLKIAGVDLSVSAAIGFIALLGQVSLLGLLVLTAVEERRDQGEALLPAVIEGAAARFRPVLMAALLAALGLLPMAVSSGVGSETQRPFAVVIIGGMVTTFLATIFILPALYTLVTRGTWRRPGEEEIG
jgi:heavy metal efflux system protein